MMGRVDIKVGFACTNHCMFCVQGEAKRQAFGRESLDCLKTILDQERAWGKDEVVFTGGEPTLHPDLADVVSYAKKTGYCRVIVQTNGQRFADLDFCRRLVGAGMDCMNPSLHGFRPETHDALVGNTGAWERTVKGIQNVRGLGVEVKANSVVTLQNYHEAPDLARLFALLGVSSFQYAFPHILGSAATNREIIIPRKSDCVPHLLRGIDEALFAGMPAYTEAIPFCLLHGYEWVAVEQYLPKTSIYDARHTLGDYESWRLAKGKLKGVKCRQCMRYSCCEGPWAEYVEMYGWDEFEPIMT